MRSLTSVLQLANHGPLHQRWTRRPGTCAVHYNDKQCDCIAGTPNTANTVCFLHVTLINACACNTKTCTAASVTCTQPARLFQAGCKLECRTRAASLAFECMHAYTSFSERFTLPDRVILHLHTVISRAYEPIHCLSCSSALGASSGVRTMRLALNNKTERHAAFLTFLHAFGLWPLLSVAARRQIAEHGEKLAVALFLASLEGVPFDDFLALSSACFRYAFMLFC